MNHKVFFLFLTYIFTARNYAQKTEMILDLDSNFINSQFYKYDYLTNKKNSVALTTSASNRLQALIDKSYCGVLFLGTYNIFLSPQENDEVYFYSREKKDTFFTNSKFPGNYSFYKFKNDLYQSKPKYSPSDDFTGFRIKNNSFFDSVMNSVNEYIKKNPVSKDFEDFLFKEIIYDKYTALVKFLEMNHPEQETNKFEENIAVHLMNDSLMIRKSSSSYFVALNYYYINAYNGDYRSSFKRIETIQNLEIRQLLFSSLLWTISRSKAATNFSDLKQKIITEITLPTILARLRG